MAMTPGELSEQCQDAKLILQCQQWPGKAMLQPQGQASPRLHPNDRHIGPDGVGIRALWPRLGLKIVAALPPDLLEVATAQQRLFKPRRRAGRWHSRWL